MSDKKPSEIIREKFSKIERARESSPTCRADLEIVNMMLQALLEYLDELVERLETEREKLFLHREWITNMVNSLMDWRENFEKNR